MSVIRILKKFRMVLNRHQKLRIVELAIMMVIAGFLEMLSVSLIMPFMTAVMDPDTIMNKDIVRWICNLTGVQIARTFLVFLAIAMALIYLGKNAFLLFQTTMQNRFVYHNMFFTQQRILHSYMLRPYEFFLSVQSGEVLRVVGGDTSQAFSLLTTLLTLFSELVVSATLIVTILIMAPWVTLGVMAIIGVMLLLIQFVIRPILASQGEKNRKANATMQQWLLQSVQGIKEIKISAREAFFEERYAKAGNVYIKTTYKNATLGLVPRFMLEAVSMAAFFIVVAIMLYKGAPLEDIVPILSVVAMAAIRLLPSANRISQALANMAFYEPALDKLIDNMAELDVVKLEGSEEEAADLDAGEIISDSNKIADLEADKNGSYQAKDKAQVAGMSDEVRLSHITYRYPMGDKDILTDADMVVHRGDSVGIVGTTGAGKTTVVDILLGLLRPKGGQVLIDGTDIRLDMEGWLHRVGYIPQTIFMLDGSIRDNVAFGIDRSDIDDAKVIKALEEAAIYDFVSELPEGLDTEIGERGIRLSGGQRQRLGIARALYENPEILVFDEATSALDNETEAAIIDSINSLQGKHTLIIIAHRLTTIAKCDKVYRVDGGKITRER